MATISILNQSGKETSKFELPSDIFTREVNKNLLYYSCVNHLANRRAGTASTKTRKDVSGGGKKPWRQKGTGRARVGSIRSPLWRKGGVVFGPHPRDFRYPLSKDYRRLSLISALNDKLSQKNIFVLEDIQVPSLKTKDFAKILATLKVSGKILLIAGKNESAVKRSARNIKGVSICNPSDVNSYAILNSNLLLLSKSSLEELISRVK